MNPTLENPLQQQEITALYEQGARTESRLQIPPKPEWRAASPEYLRAQPHLHTAGHHPETLAFRSRPRRKQEENGRLHRSVFPDRPFSVNDNRYSYYDPVFPWSAFGRVTSGRFKDGTYIAASGVMVGPRHVLTSSRIVGWHPGQLTDWLVFTPSYCNGVTPFGTAYAQTIYAWRDLDYLEFDSRLDLMANDYAVVVLDHRLGEATGWVGSLQYNPAWNGQAAWDFLSYSADFNNGQEPVFQNGATMLDASTPPGAEPPAGATLMNYDAWMGKFVEFENGGLFVGWFAGEPWPRVVATQTVFADVYPPTIPASYVHRYACGGNPQVALIQQALAEFP